MRVSGSLGSNIKFTWRYDESSREEALLVRGFVTGLTDHNIGLWGARLLSQQLSIYTSVSKSIFFAILATADACSEEFGINILTPHGESRIQITQ